MKDGKSISVSVNYQCGGTLINHYTILTAAHCINKEIEYVYNGATVILPVKPNKYFPTLESTFTVLLGIHDLNTFTPPSVAFTVKSVIMVRHDV
jgi:hypothetical protein